MEQVILLDKTDLALLKRGEVLTLAFAGGTRYLVADRGAFLSGANGHHASNGHGPAPAASEPSKKTARRKRGKGRGKYERVSFTEAQEKEYVARLHGGDFAQVKALAEELGVSRDRIYSMHKKVTGRTLTPRYVCRQCRPAQTFKLGQEYSGHMRMKHNNPREQSA